eukprot:TRINITY_DN8324_c0_g3_i2.p1 TRINITY_DN8324_c0_g3~~TRINITY_DN8324_c0_g3_i2.p1  ORF type:complete len:233 (-),score=37.74 TRINITY_DN8324_c0_g3_i2:8-706(-)
MVGAAIRDSGVPRQDIFLVSKLPPSHQGYEEAIKSCEESLQRLGTSYLDLYLIHWPGKSGLKTSSELNKEARRESWRAMEDLYKSGKCKAVGVSNYLVSHLQDLMEHSSFLPMVNQFELHPLLPQHELREFCAKHNIVVEAYSSLGQGRSEVLGNPQIKQAAAQLSKTPSQIALRWAVQQGIVVIPKTTKEERLSENANLFDFEIPSELMAVIDSIGRDISLRCCWDPQTVV